MILAMSAPSDTRSGISTGLIVGLAVGWNTTNIGAIATPAADAYGIPLAVVGLFTTALFVTHLATQIPGGRAVDALGARPICLVGVAVIAVSTSLSMIAPLPVLGIGARALAGIGTGLGFIGGSALVRRSGGSPLAQGLYGGIGLGSGGLALAVVPALVDSLSWRAPYASALALALVALAALALVPSDAPVASTGSSATRTAVIGDRRLLPLALLYSTTFGLSLVLANWVVELLQRHGVSEGDAGLIGAMVLVLGIIARPLGGWILRSRPRWIRTAVGLSLAAGGIGTALLAASGSTLGAVVGCVLLGIGGGISFSPSFTGASLLRPDAPAAAVGFVNATAAATVLVFAPIVGLTFSMPGEGRLGFAAVAVAWLLALVALPDRTSLGGAPADRRPRPRT